MGVAIHMHCAKYLRPAIDVNFRTRRDFAADLHMFTGCDLVCDYAIFDGGIAADVDAAADHDRMFLHRGSVGNDECL